MHYVKYCPLLLLLMAGNNIWAQVPVREEPHHKPVLENNYVRLLDVHIKPGDTTLYHVHAAPSVIVHITKSLIGIQVMGQPITPSTQTLPGQTKFVDYDKNPVTHRVYNSDKTLFHVMDIELVKKEPANDSCAAFQNITATTTINEKLVRVYKFDLDSQNTINMPAGNCAHLLICVSGTVNTAGKKITAGEYIFFNPGLTVAVNNKNAGIASCVLLELK
jgi:hypothetical protein